MERSVVEHGKTSCGAPSDWMHGRGKGLANSFSPRHFDSFATRRAEE